MGGEEAGGEEGEGEVVVAMGGSVSVTRCVAARRSENKAGMGAAPPSRT